MTSLIRGPRDKMVSILGSTLGDAELAKAFGREGAIAEELKDRFAFVDVHLTSGKGIPMGVRRERGK